MLSICYWGSTKERAYKPRHNFLFRSSIWCFVLTIMMMILRGRLLLCFVRRWICYVCTPGTLRARTTRSNHSGSKQRRSKIGKYLEYRDSSIWWPGGWMKWRRYEHIYEQTFIVQKITGHNRQGLAEFITSWSCMWPEHLDESYEVTAAKLIHMYRIYNDRHSFLTRQQTYYDIWWSCILRRTLFEDDSSSVKY